MMPKCVPIAALTLLLVSVSAPVFAEGHGTETGLISEYMDQAIAFLRANIVLVGAGFAALFAVLALRSLLAARRGAEPDTLAIHSLVAMSQVAIADGRIDDTEVKQIAVILTRLTGKVFGADEVMDMLRRLNPSASDLAQVGQDLSDKDRQLVLEAALSIAVADSDIHPNEYAVVSDLAQRMRIGSDQFRNAMDRISAHMERNQPV